MDIQEFVVNRDQHMRPLEYDLSENFNALLRYMQDMGILDNVPVGTTSESEIVSIYDAYPAPPRALNVYGKSTQDGTPTPDAPVPILSVDDLSLVLHGANLLDAFNDPSNPDKNCISSGNGTAPYAYDSTEGGYYSAGHRAFELSRKFVAGDKFTFSADIKIRNGSTSTYTYAILPRYATVYPVPVGRSSYSQSAWKHVEGVLTVPSNGVVGFNTYTDILIRNVQIQYGSTATAYEPYQGQTIPLLPEGTSLRSLPDGTRDTLNLAYLRPSTREGWAWYEREVVQRVSETTVGACSWTAYYTKNFYSSLNGNCRVARIGLSEFLCSDLVSATTTSLAASSSNPDDSIFGRATEPNVIIRTASSYESAAAFKTAYADAVIHYPLATPVTTQLDPIELPQLPAPNATVWCDGGNAQPTLMLEYVRNASAAIADLSEAIADIVSG